MVIMMNEEKNRSAYLRPSTDVVNVESEEDVLNSVSIEIGADLGEFENDETDPFAPEPANLDISPGFALSVLEYASDEESDNVWE